MGTKLDSRKKYRNPEWDEMAYETSKMFGGPNAVKENYLGDYTNLKKQYGLRPEVKMDGKDDIVYFHKESKTGSPKVGNVASLLAEISLKNKATMKKSLINRAKELFGIEVKKNIKERMLEYVLSVSEPGAKKIELENNMASLVMGALKTIDNNLRRKYSTTTIAQLDLPSLKKEFEKEIDRRVHGV